MDKDTIKRRAYQRMSLIEEVCSHGHVANTLRAYWLLNLIIAEGFRSYFESYGLLSIDKREADEGRQQLRLGPLCQFEKDAINMLNDKIENHDLSQPHFRVVNEVDISGSHQALGGPR